MKAKKVVLAGSLLLIAAFSFSTVSIVDNTDGSSPSVPQIREVSRLVALYDSLLSKRSKATEITDQSIEIDLTEHLRAQESGAYTLPIPSKLARVVWAHLNSEQHSTTATIRFLDDLTVTAVRTSDVNRYDDSSVLDWMGESADGRVLQITAQLPGTLIITYPTRHGLIYLTPDRGAAETYKLQVPSAPQSMHGTGTSRSDSLGSAVASYCDVPGKMDSPAPKIITAFLSSEVSKTAEEQLRNHQLLTLNRSLASSGIPLSFGLNIKDLPLSHREAAGIVTRDLICVDEEGASGVTGRSRVDLASSTALLSLIESTANDMGIFVMDFGSVVCPAGKERRTPPVCGEALEIGHQSQKIRLAMINGECLTYSRAILTHEVGHLLGARHEYYADSEGDRYNHASPLRERIDEERPCFLPKDPDRVRWHETFLAKLSRTPLCKVGGITGTVDSSGIYSQKIPIFSNPEATCKGARPAFSDPQADNARSILAVLRPLPELPAKAQTCSALPRSYTVSCSALVDQPDVITFGLNSSEYEDEEKASKIINRYREHQGDLIVVGFASSSGEPELNMALSMKRASRAAQDIRALEEGDVRRIGICPYGEEFAQCFEPDGGEASAMRVQIYRMD